MPRARRPHRAPRLFFLACLLTIPAAADDKKPDPKADADAPKGPWEVVRTTFDGNEVPRGGDGGKAYGIYALDKDGLKNRYGESGAERPKAFESKAGSKLFLVVLRRVKG